MTHVLTLPDFSPLPADGERIPFHADPILAAIEAHSEAWAAFQIAPQGRAGEAAEIKADDALHALLATPCATRAGMFCLIRHLRWWLDDEAQNAGSYRTDGGVNAWGVAQAREADLSRCLGVERIERLPLALPSGRLLAPVLDLKPVSTSTSGHAPPAARERRPLARLLRGDVPAARHAGAEARRRDAGRVHASAAGRLAHHGAARRCTPRPRRGRCRRNT